MFLEAVTIGPGDLYRGGDAGLAAGGCGADWLIVDSRPQWRTTGHATVDEGDVRAFTVVEESLSLVGVHLVDAVVLDDACHWWSMRELTTGETSWVTGRSAET